MTTVKEVEIKVRQFVTKFKDNPMPLRIMFGVVESETPKAYKVKLKGKPFPSTICMKCGRALTHPVSLLYSIGPECAGHYHINPFQTEEELNEHYEELRQKLSDITWEGWVPKSGVEYVKETGETIEVEEKKPKKEEGKVETQKSVEKKPMKFTDKLIEELTNELESVL